MLPLKGKNKVTAYFKQKNKILWKTFGWHTGIDFVGSDDVYSTVNGAVHNVAYDKSYGNYIIIQESGTNRYHYFCHQLQFLNFCLQALPAHIHDKKYYLQFLQNLHYKILCCLC